MTIGIFGKFALSTYRTYTTAHTHELRIAKMTSFNIDLMEINKDKSF